MTPTASITLRGPAPTYSIHGAHPHAIIADSAELDVPHANPWLLSGAAPSRWAGVRVLVCDDAGTWTARAQSPCSREDEVLLLDEDVLERDLATGRVGRCGARGCRVDVGCAECERAGRDTRSPRAATGAKCARDESPRTQFRGAAPQDDPLRAEEEFPIHLQRLKTPTVVVDMKPQQRTGPKIKYIRKRTLPLVERVGNKRRKTASGRFTK